MEKRQEGDPAATQEGKLIWQKQKKQRPACTGQTLGNRLVCAEQHLTNLYLTLVGYISYYLVGIIGTTVVFAGPLSL